MVLETYYRHKDIDKSMKPHRVATIIRNLLGKKMQKPPSLNTIKRYLKEEKLIT
jgi:hypothetical protein